jgi:cytochrome c oxidase assembly protein subunit 15
LAVLVLAAVLWVAFDLGRSETERRTEGRGRGIALVLLGLVYGQILAGALVAGLHAGMGYNTWPLMDGALVPGGLGVMQPWWLNAFENAMTVQFDHRVLAYVIAVVALANVLAAGARARRIAGLLLLAVLVQAALGIFTLLTQVQLGLALAHQAGAILVFALALYYVHGTAGCSHVTR